MSMFSIIIPVYNAAYYLSRCIDSILSQSYVDFELTLINDGSTDNSGEICDIYAKQDKRIKVYHQKNAGVSSARNLGLENAQGEWVLFVDADDWVESNYLETVNRKMQLINGDLYMFGHRRLNEKQIFREFCPTYMVENNINFVKTKYYRHSCWNYAFRNSIIKKWNIRFPIELKRAEDQAFLLKYISTISNVVLIDKILYNYWDNPDSTVNQQVDNSWAVSNIRAANDFLQFCKRNDVLATFFEHQVKRFYDDFFKYYKKIENVNKRDITREYRKAYKNTLQLYPEFRKYKFFKIANYNLALPVILRNKKNKVKNNIKKILKYLPLKIRDKII